MFSEMLSENVSGGGGFDGTGTIKYCYSDGATNEKTITLSEPTDFIIGYTHDLVFSNTTLIAVPNMQMATRGETISWKSHNNYASICTATLSDDGLSVTYSRNSAVGNTQFLLGTFD